MSLHVIQKINPVINNEFSFKNLFYIKSILSFTFMQISKYKEILEGNSVFRM